MARYLEVIGYVVQYFRPILTNEIELALAMRAALLLRRICVDLTPDR